MDAVSCALNISTAFTESVPHKCTASTRNGPGNFWNTCVSICRSCPACFRSILRVRRGTGQSGVHSYVSERSPVVDAARIPYTWSQFIWCGAGSAPCIGHCLSSSTISFTFLGSSSSLRNMPRYPNPEHRSMTFTRLVASAGTPIASTCFTTRSITGAHSFNSFATRPDLMTRVQTLFGNDARHLRSTATLLRSNSGYSTAMRMVDISCSSQVTVSPHVSDVSSGVAASSASKFSPGPPATIGTSSVTPGRSPAAVSPSRFFFVSPRFERSFRNKYVFLLPARVGSRSDGSGAASRRTADADAEAAVAVGFEPASLSGSAFGGSASFTFRTASATSPTSAAAVFDGVACLFPIAARSERVSRESSLSRRNTTKT